MKRLVRSTVRTRTFASLVRLLEALGHGRENLLYVLTYHRIDEPERAPDLDPRLISASPEEFERHAAVLSETCRVVTPGDVLSALDGGPPLPPRAVLITFDDGYEDFALHAWPILREHRLSATLFVATAFPGQPARGFWWDRLHRAIRNAAPDAALDIPGGPFPLATAEQRAAAAGAAGRYVRSVPHAEGAAAIDTLCRSLGSSGTSNTVLGWEALRQLAAEGLILAPHSRTHPLLNRLSLDEAIEEAVGSRRDLEREVGPVPPCFAYPGGGFGDDLPRRLGEAGFRMAFTVCRGVNDLRSADPLRLRRINVGWTTSAALLRAQVLPWMTLVNRFVPLNGAP